MRIEIFSHSFRVTDLSQRQKAVVETFCRTLIQWKKVFEGGMMRSKPDKVYASADRNRQYYRFHINLLKDFNLHIAYHQIGSSEVERITNTLELNDHYSVEYRIKSIRELGGEGYEMQPELLQHILNPGTNKILNLQAGGGKTLIASHAMFRLALRTSITMRGGLIDRWVPDLEKTFEYKKGELLIIRGSKSMNAIMEMALEGDLRNVKTLMFSLDTIDDYIKHYEENGQSDLYPVEPGLFHERLGIGFGVLDEGHQNAHQVMKMFSYMNMFKHLTLSATLETRDPFKNKMYLIMYPMQERAGKDFYKVYMHAKAILYQIRRPKALKYTGFGGAYNHNTFEASLMLAKNKVELKNYIDLITWVLEEFFIKVMEKGQKAIIFCATKNLCTLLTKYYQRKYPHLKVVRYIGEDKMSVLNEGDLIVSTVLSAGTGVDIPNLRTGIMTTAIDSQQSNEQTKNRTRPLKDWPHVEPMFLYFACTEIQQHMKYHRNKLDAFTGLVKSHTSEQAPITV